MESPKPRPVVQKPPFCYFLFLPKQIFALGLSLFKFCWILLFVFFIACANFYIWHNTLPDQKLTAIPRKKSEKAASAARALPVNTMKGIRSDLNVEREENVVKYRTSLEALVHELKPEMPGSLPIGLARHNESEELDDVQQLSRTAALLTEALPSTTSRGMMQNLSDEQERTTRHGRSERRLAKDSILENDISNDPSQHLTTESFEELMKLAMDASRLPHNDGLVPRYYSDESQNGHSVIDFEALAEKDREDFDARSMLRRHGSHEDSDHETSNATKKRAGDKSAA